MAINMEFTKHFCRLVTETELSDDDVIEFFDIVQSTVPVKLVIGHTDDDEKVNVQVTQYENSEGLHIYEILLKEQVNLDEGEEISDMLMQTFDFDFDFETSMEI